MPRLLFFRVTQSIHVLLIIVYLHFLQEPSLGIVKRETKMKKQQKVPACKNLHLLVTALCLICLSVIMTMNSQNLMSKELMGWALDMAETPSA